MSDSGEEDVKRSSLKEKVSESLSTADSKAKRDVPVMTRLSSEVVEMLNILVKLDIFSSRSEGVASIVEKTVLSHAEDFELLKSQLKRLEEVQDAARNIASNVLGEDEHQES